MKTAEKMKKSKNMEKTNQKTPETTENKVNKKTCQNVSH